MRHFKSGRIAVFLTIILVFNLMVFGIGTGRVKAGVFDDYKGGIITVIKGVIMLWLINLMRGNATGGGSDDIITSTIKKGLNLGENKDSLEIPAEDNNSNVVIMEEAQIQEKSLNEFERKLVGLVNQTRERNGLNVLKADEKLVSVARKKAVDMIDNNYFDHNSPAYGSPFAMMKDEGIKYSLAGENLAGARTVEEAFDSLMESPQHRDNILKARYDRIGVGVIEGGPYELMIVQLFIDSPDPAE